MITVKWYNPGSILGGNCDDLTVAEIDELYRLSDERGALAVLAYDQAAPLSLYDFRAAVMRLVEVGGEIAGVYSKGGKPLGYFLLMDFEGDTARVHFAASIPTCDELVAGGKIAILAALLRHNLKALRGIVPIINHGACRYAEAVGGRLIGTIPNICYIARLGRTCGGQQYIFER